MALCEASAIHGCWLTIGSRQPLWPVACEMVEPRHRTIVDIEHEALFGLAAKRKTDGGLDRAAMGNDDHVPARLLGIDALDGADRCGYRGP